MRTWNFLAGLLLAWTLVAAGYTGTTYAADVVPDGTTSTTLDAAQNDVTIVNIAPPNTDGVSRNTYTNFSVDNTGVILNNSDQAGTSQLGGAILPNSQYNLGTGASIVLNEVSSTNISTLGGYTEIFGREAQFVLANPNGITCNGCGFINTSRATLITGSEINPIGTVGAFNIGPGSISITGAGLNGSNVSYVELISRAVIIQAGIQAADQLGIYTGNDQYNYATQQVSSLAGVAGAPTYAIDAYLLGSMYANTIKLVATEAGVGVRSLGLLSAQNEINIQANGNIETASAQAGNTIFMRANAITQNGVYKAGNSIDLEADTLNLLDRIESDINTRLVQRVGDWTLGELFAGSGLTELIAQNGTLTLSGAVSAGGDLSVSANNIINQNTAAARRNVTFSTSGNLSNQANGLIFAGQNLRLLVDGTLENYGTLYAQGTLTATNRADGKMVALRNKGGRIESIGSMLLRAELLENTHNMLVDAAPTDFTQTDRPLVRINDGVVNGVSNWHEEINPAMKRGLIQTDANLTIDANNLVNNVSDIFANGDMNITATTFDNKSLTLREAVTDSYAVWQKVGETCGSFNFFGWCIGGWSDVNAWVTYYQQLIQNTASSIPATVQAGGALTANISGAVNNTGSVLSDIAPTTTTSLVDPLTSISLPGEGGFFVPNPSPSAAHPYLIETNPALIDVGTLYGSTYFLDRIGYVQTEDLTLFLGDAWYDQKVIAEQVRLLSGQRYLFANARSDNEQYQLLVQQAAVERERLSLEVGVALTNEQAAALEQSIVWYVTVDFKGHSVLAPRIYLAGDSKLQSPGATIAANSIEINAGNVLNEGVIISETVLAINSAEDISNRSGTVEAGTALTLVAGNNINNETASWYRESGADIDAGLHTTARFISRGDLNMRAANNIGMNAATIESAGHVDMIAGNDLTLNAQKITNRTNYTDPSRWNHTRTEIAHATSSVNVGGDLRINTGKDIFMEAANVTVAGDTSLKAGGSINMVSVQDSVETSRSRTSYGFLSSETITETNKNVTSRGTSIATSNNLSVDSGNNIVLHGSQLASGGDASLTTRGGDILLLADRSSTSSRFQRLKDDFISEASEDRGHYREKLAASTIQSGGRLSFDTAAKGRSGDVVMSGATVSSENGLRFGGYEEDGKHELGDDGRDSNGRRINNLRIESASVKDQQWNYKHSGLKGWAAFIAAGVSGLVGGDGVEIERTNNTRTDLVNQQGSDVTTAGDLSAHTSGDITVSGSNVSASGRGTLDAEGDVNILSALNEERNRTLSSHMTASEVTLKSDKSRVSIGIDGEYRKEEIDVTKHTNQASNLQFGGDLDIKSGGATTVAASNLYSDQSIDINADDGINILSAQDVLDRTTKNTEADSRVSFGVGNAYNDIHQAVDGYKRAQEGRRSAEKALRDFDAELRGMQADLEKGLLTADDIRLRREDRKFYEANVALAVVNEASSLIAIAQSGAAAASAAASSYGTGFYASVKLEIEGRETNKGEQSSQSVGSQIIAGRDVVMTSGRDIHIQGSDISANGDITLAAANDLLIEAGKNTQGSNENRKSTSFSISYGSNGVTGWDAGFNTGFDRAKNTSWRNSTVGAGGTLTLQSGNDTTLAGANAQGRNVVANVGGDLSIQSRQNSTNSAGQDAGISIGSSSVGVNGGSRNQIRRWVEDVTSLTGSESVAIRTQGNTELVGAVLAQVDDNGVDGGNLSLKTGSLTYRDITDYDNASNWSAGISTGSGKTSIQANTGGHVRGQITHATLGKGILNFASDGEVIPEGLNRDINALTTVTANRQTGGLDANVTIDHRMLSKAGWQSIGRDFKDSGQFGVDIANAIKTINESGELNITNLGQTIRNNAGVTLALNDLARNPEMAPILRDLKSDDPQANQRGWKAFGNILQTKYGIKPTDTNFYNANTVGAGSLQESGQGVWGGTVVDPNSREHGNIFINVGDPTVNQRQLGFTLGHEIGETGYAQGRGYTLLSDTNAQREALNDQLGQRVVGRLNDIEPSVFVTGNQSAWNYGLQNSGYTAYGQSRANNVGYANVEYRQLHTNEVNWIERNATAFGAKYGLTNTEAKQRLAQQAYRQVQFGVAGERDAQAQQFLRRASGYAAFPSDPRYPNSGWNRMFITDPYSKANADIYSGTLATHGDFYNQNGLVLPSLENMRTDARQDAAGRKIQRNRFLAATAVTATVILAPVIPYIYTTALASPATLTELFVGGSQMTAEVVSGATIVGLGTTSSPVRRYISRLDMPSPSVVPLTVRNQATNFVSSSTRSLPGGEGHFLAGTVTEGGSGTALTGHGAKFLDDGKFTVPDGTAITLPRSNINILDRTGQYIETGDWDGLAKLAKFDPRVAKDIEGMATWLPGSKVPGYTLFAPDGRINLFSNSLSVNQPTPLRQLLEPNQGCVQWAACTEFLNYKQ